jgi:hypothetical protein
MYCIIFFNSTSNILKMYRLLWNAVIMSPFNCKGYTPHCSFTQVHQVLNRTEIYAKENFGIFDSVGRHVW